jgi:protein SCO1/2
LDLKELLFALHLKMKKLFWIKYSVVSFLFWIFYSCTEQSESSQESAKNETETSAQLPYYNEATFQPNWINEEDSLDGFHQIRPFKLIDQKGNAFTENKLVGKIYVADFFFATCGGICPKMTSNMSILQDEFIDEPEILLLSHSVTPTIDTPAALSDYADRNGIHYKKWKLLTGERSEIYDLGRNFYFIEENLGLLKGEDDFLHTENFVLIDQDRRIRGIYNGLNKTSINYLIEDIKTLQSN